MTATLPTRTLQPAEPAHTWSALLRQVLRPLPAAMPAPAEPTRARRDRTSIAPLEWG